jgi:hypothetical protein
MLLLGFIRCLRQNPHAFKGRVLRSQKQLTISSLYVIFVTLRPRLWNEVATWEPTVIEKCHQDGDPALAKDTDQAELRCWPWPGCGAVIIR